MGSIASGMVIEHNGTPRDLVTGLARELVANFRRRGQAIHPQVFFIGPHTVTTTLLHRDKIGA